MSRIYCFLFVLLLVLGFDASSKPLPVPSYTIHKHFLLNDWKPDAPTVIAFKDPFCGYCIKALKKKSEMDGFNVFLFWYPIFGEKSVNRVSHFFKCEKPVTKDIIQSVIKREEPLCNGSGNAFLESLNRKMYQAYMPSGVPAYYFSGQKVSVSWLNSMKNEVDSIKQQVKVDWGRYQNNKYSDSEHNLAKAAIFLSSDFSLEKLPYLRELIKSKASIDWYVFSNSSSILQKMQCNNVKKATCELTDMQKKNIEFSLLFGVDDQNAIVLNGKLLSQSEVKRYLGNIAALL